MCGIHGTIVPVGHASALDALAVVAAMHRRHVHAMRVENAAAPAWLLAQLARWMERFGITA